MEKTFFIKVSDAVRPSPVFQAKTREQVLKELINSEETAIAEYEHATNISTEDKELFDHIKSEEMQHKQELTDALNGKPFKKD